MPTGEQEPEDLVAKAEGVDRATRDAWIRKGERVSFWIIMVPLNYYLGITAGLGINGLFFGIGISVLAASLFLAVRFALLTRRHIRPV